MSDTQFLVSMKFVGIDAVSPEIKKITDQVKQVKQQMTGMFSGGGGSNNMKKFFDDFSNGLKNANNQLDKFKKSMSELKSSGFNDILKGTAIITPIVKSLQDAGEMQRKMITIGGATGVNDTTGIMNAIKSASSVTKFSSNEVADLAVKLATSGMNGDQVQQLTPIMAKFAEVQQFGKGSSPAESVTEAISASHMLGIYDPKSLDAYLNKFNAATFMTPGSTSEFFDTFKYLAPTAKGMGMSNDDILYTSALANRVGMIGSMGGTDAADMIMRGIPGLFGGDSHVDKKGHLKAGKPLKAMMDLGLAQADGSSVFFNDQGKFLGIKNFIDQLSEASHKVNPEQFTKDLHAMLGTQGMKLADILSERGAEQLEIIKKQMDNMKNITQFQEDFNKSYEGQLAQLKTNIGNLEQQVGGVLLPTATKFVSSIQPYVDVTSQWISGHQKEVEQYGKVAAEFGLFLGAVGAAKLALGTLGSFLTPTMKSGVNILTVVVDAIKAQMAKSTISPKEMLPQNIQANVVNVYGKAISGGIGGEPGGSTVIPTESGGSGGNVKKGAGPVIMSGIQTFLKSIKASLPIAITWAGYDILTAPEGQKIKTAAKDGGGVIGGIAGTAAGVEMGAALGSVIPGIGTVIGGLLGGIIGTWAGNKLGEKLSDAANAWLSSHTLTPKISLPSGNTPNDTFHFYSNGNPLPSYSNGKPQLVYQDQSTNHYHIQSTDPQSAADEIENNRNNMLKTRTLIENGNR